MCRKRGSQSSRLFKVEGEANKAVVLFEWESRKAFEGFLADPFAKETIKSSGTLGPPKFTFLEKAGEFPSWKPDQRVERLLYTQVSNRYTCLDPGSPARCGLHF